MSFISVCQYTASLDLDIFPENFRSAIIGNYDCVKDLFALESGSDQVSDLGYSLRSSLTANHKYNYYLHNSS